MNTTSFAIAELTMLRDIVSDLLRSGNVYRDKTLETIGVRAGEFLVSPAEVVAFVRTLYPSSKVTRAEAVALAAAFDLGHDDRKE